MTQHLRVQIVLADDQGSVPSTQKAALNCLTLRSQGSDSLSWLLQALHAQDAEIHAGKKTGKNSHTHKIKMNLEQN